MAPTIVVETYKRYCMVDRFGAFSGLWKYKKSFVLCEYIFGQFIIYSMHLLHLIYSVSHCLS